MKIRRMIFTVLITMLLLSACAPGQGMPGESGFGPQVWFDSPKPDSVFYPPNPISLVTHASDPDGISSFELSVNGAVAAEIPSPNTSDTLVTLTYDWHPPEPGTYTLEMRALSNSGNWSPVATTVVVVPEVKVPDANAPTITPTIQKPSYVLTPTPTPTQPPQRADVRVLSYSTTDVFVRGTGCGPKAVIIQAEAFHPDGIKVVVVFFRVKEKDPGKVTDFAEAAMYLVGNNLYEVSINPEAQFGGTLASYDESWLQVQLVVQTNTGDTSTRTEVLSDVTFKLCSR